LLEILGDNPIKCHLPPGMTCRLGRGWRVLWVGISTSASFCRLPRIFHRLWDNGRISV